MQQNEEDIDQQEVTDTYYHSRELAPTNSKSTRIAIKKKFTKIVETDEEYKNDIDVNFKIVI